MFMFLLIFLLKAENINSLYLNNACPTYIDYYFIVINPRCYYNPDTTTNFQNIMSNNFETYSEHNVTTEDGYIISLYQIPQDNPKGVIIMQNALTSDAIQFVAERNTSFAQTFHQEGYEIWLASTRGTALSPGHVNLTHNDAKYWNWTFYDNGIYDTRSVITYVKDQIDPNVDLIFLGHSQSGAEALIYASMFPEEAKEKVTLFLLLAPAAFYVTPYRLEFIFRIVALILKVLDAFGKHSLVQLYSIESIIARTFAVVFPIKRISASAIDLVAGLSPNEQDPNLFYTIFVILFRGTSTRNLMYYFQLAATKRFEMVDYGKNKNLELYGTKNPPEYPVEKIIAPVYLFGGENDGLATAQGIKILNSRLSDATKVYGGPQIIKKFNHISYIVGKDRLSYIDKMRDVLNLL